MTYTVVSGQPQLITYQDLKDGEYAIVEQTPYDSKWVGDIVQKRGGIVYFVRSDNKVSKLSNPEFKFVRLKVKEIILERA